MILFRKCNCGPCLSFIRNVHIYPALESNHYKALGLSPSATQAEIKSAFYELSKKHHPDKNRGCEKSAKKFKDITAAYDVLKNEKLRQKYDNEQMSRQPTDYSQTAHEAYDYNDEDERNFYQRTCTSKSKTFYGKTKQYDFEAWYKAHYGPNSFYVHEYTPKASRSNIKIHIKYKNSDHNQHHYQYQYRYQYQYQKQKTSQQAGKSIKLIIYFLAGGSTAFLIYKCVNDNR